MARSNSTVFTFIRTYMYECKFVRFQFKKNISDFFRTDDACHVKKVLKRSFIHFNIYIAPLQERYSEALPTPARLRSSLKVRKAQFKWSY